MMEILAYYQSLSAYVQSILYEIGSVCDPQEALVLQRKLQSFYDQIQNQIQQVRLHGC